jgi:hypothetical protein
LGRGIQPEAVEALQGKALEGPGENHDSGLKNPPPDVHSSCRHDAFAQGKSI